MGLALRAHLFVVAGLAGGMPLAAQQPAARPPATPPAAEQGNPSDKQAPAPAVQQNPRTRADTLRALAEPIDTVRVDAQPTGKPPDSLAVEPGPPWHTSYFPYLTGTGGDFMVAARVRRWLPAAFEDRLTYRSAIGVDAGVGVHGSWFATATWDSPLLMPNLRTLLTATASRLTRFGFYGLGNNTEYDKSLQDTTQPNLFRVERTTYEIHGEVTRRIIGPLALAGRVGAESVRFEALDGRSTFADSYGPTLSQDDVNGRIALLYDTRNNEYNTTTGVLLETGFEVGSGGAGYTRKYVMLDGYVPLRGSTVLAARLGGADIHGTPTLNARFELPTWNTPLSVYGGYTSNRGYTGGRFVGRGVILGSLELRQEFLPLGEIAAATLIAFVDAGRVFENQAFTVDGRALHVAGGIGVAARLLRSTIFTVNIARGGEGWRISAGSGWAF